MRDEPEVMLSLESARIRAMILRSRRLAARAHRHARRQDRYVQAVRERAQGQSARSVNAWPASHGLVVARGDQDDADVLALVLESARALFDGAASVSLTTVDQLAGDQRPYRTVAATGDAAVIDAAQYVLGEGPCVDAVELDTVAVVRADDLTARETCCWPRFAEAAAALRVRSALSISIPWSPLSVGLDADRRALGSINFYAPQAHAFGQTESYARMLGSWAGSIVTGRAPAEVYDTTFQASGSCGPAPLA